MPPQQATESQFHDHELLHYLGSDSIYPLFIYGDALEVSKAFPDKSIDRESYKSSGAHSPTQDASRSGRVSRRSQLAPVPFVMGGTIRSRWKSL